MDKIEAKEIKGARLPQQTEAYVRPILYVDLDHYHGAELGQEFDWTPERKEALVALVEAGYSLTQIGKQRRAGWPTLHSIKKERSRDDIFNRLLDNARANRAESLVDLALMVADVSTPATAASDRIRVDSFLKVAALLDPGRFGARSSLEVSGGLVLAAGSLAELAAQGQALAGGKSGGNPQTMTINSPVLEGVSVVDVKSCPGIESTDATRGSADQPPAAPLSPPLTGPVGRGVNASGSENPRSEK